MTNHENRTTGFSAAHTGALVTALLAVGLVGVLALAAAPASAHQSPVDCNAADLGVSIARDKATAEQGETVHFRVLARNPATGEVQACDVTSADVIFTEPAADGTPTGTAHTLASNAAFPADGSADACYVATGSPLTCPADTVQLIDDNLAWTVSVSDGVGSATASAEIVGPLNQPPCNDGGAILHDSENENAACAANAVSVTIESFDLVVEKTADTTFDREWNWDVTKLADQTEFIINEGESITVNYDVEASLDGEPVDSDWAVSGEITITNPSNVGTAEITDVSDVISGYGAADNVNCPVTFPHSLGPQEQLVCTYSSMLPDGSSRTNTASATVSAESDVGGGSGQADVVFGGPTNLIDFCAEVTDTNVGLLGSVCSDTSPVLFEYSLTFGTADTGSDVTVDCGDNQHDNTATITEQDTGQSATATESVFVTVECTPGLHGCTPGFWKNHHNVWEGYTPNQMLNTVFTFPGSLSAMGFDTFDDALNYKGGGGAEGAARNLLRHATAALLNAAHSNVDYPLSESEIIDATNAALASEDRGTMNDLKNDFDEFNNLGCSIDAHGNPIDPEEENEVEAE